MDICELKIKYKNLLKPIFKEKLIIEQNEKNWVTFILDGKQEDFFFSLYGTDCVHLYWCNECFIFNKHRNNLVSSDTHGEIVFEDDFNIEHLPNLIVNLILQLKDCTYISKIEKVKGKTPLGYDDIRDYIITAKSKNFNKTKYQLANITIEYII